MDRSAYWTISKDVRPKSILELQVGCSAVEPGTSKMRCGGEPNLAMSGLAAWRELRILAALGELRQISLL